MSKKAVMLEIKPRMWTTEEIRRLKKKYPNTPTHELAGAMGKSYMSVKKMASRLKIRKTRRFCRAHGLPYQG